ncbi:DedA family protein [Fundidesulfovibrio soli]|uniref:DedA family protein n=1 Tax=Fundidesulfovibrio soli TaxID=2922716 RepID=UPI001FB021DA|nr:DedA family protein [Fundidesulfovibrio soli]
MLETLEGLISNYGYLALFIGTFLEGETILLVAGFLAHSGQLDISLCILWAFLGSLSGDQAAFYIGRFKGKKFVENRPKWKCQVERVHAMLERFHEALILSFRFFYGLRNLTPFILGTTDISGVKFFVLNAIGAGIWAVSFAYAGYFFGTVVANVLKDIHHIEMIILIVAVVVGGGVWFYRHRKRVREQQEAALTGECAAPAEDSKPGQDK